MMRQIFSFRFSTFGCVAALILGVLAGSVSAASSDTDFDAANRAYGAGHYADAIKGYEKVTKENGYSAAVLFNLGNAYQRNGQTGLAVLNYERALRLSPRDPDIQANLKFAREQSHLPQPVQRWWRVLLTSLTPSQWAWLASGVFTVLCAAWVVRLLRPEVLKTAGVNDGLLVPMWRLLLFVVGFGLFVIVACGALSVQERHEAIVVAKEASLLVSPFDKSEVLVALPEGESVNAEKKYGDYILVRYEKGKSGWVNQSQIVTVEPDLLSGAP